MELNRKERRYSSEYKCLLYYEKCTSGKERAGIRWQEDSYLQDTKHNTLAYAVRLQVPNFLVCVFVGDVISTLPRGSFTCQVEAVSLAVSTLHTAKHTQPQFNHSSEYVYNCKGDQLENLRIREISKTILHSFSDPAP